MFGEALELPCLRGVPISVVSLILFDHVTNCVIEPALLTRCLR
jgi:hypothetical protein